MLQLARHDHDSGGAWIRLPASLGAGFLDFLAADGEREVDGRRVVHVALLVEQLERARARRLVVLPVQDHCQTQTHVSTS